MQSILMKKDKRRLAQEKPPHHRDFVHFRNFPVKRVTKGFLLVANLFNPNSPSMSTLNRIFFATLSTGLKHSRDLEQN